jgi:hypothetical protein
MTAKTPSFGTKETTQYRVSTILKQPENTILEAMLEELGDAPETPRSQFASNLHKIRALGANKEASLWIALAKALDPDDHQLPPDFVANDFLRRNFDATSEGLGYLFDQVAKPCQTGAGEEDRIDLQGLCEIAANHIGFIQGVGNSGKFEDLDHPALKYLTKVTSMPCTKQTFEYIIRSLRIGKLMAMIRAQPFASQWTQSGHYELYYYDYDVHTIGGSFVPSRRMKRVPGRRHHYNIPCVAPQCGMGMDTQTMTLEEYLFTDHLSQKRNVDGVHWLHAHNPGDKVVLALAQHWMLPPSMMDRLTRLYDALPVVHFKTEDTPQEENLEDRIRMNCGLDKVLSWAVLILPAVHLTTASKEDLGAHNGWFWNRDIGGSKEKPPPQIRVACIVSNLALVWASSDWSIVISVSSEPTYLGKWISDDDSHKAWGFWKGLSDLFTTCTCKCSSCWFRSNGYERLKQEDSDEESSVTSRTLPVSPRTQISTDVAEVDEDGTFTRASEELVGYRVPPKEQHCASFEKSFEQVLIQLGEPHSILRAGTDVQLVTRIVLNRTRSYLEVVNLYKAAIVRLQYLLKDRDQRNKDTLIANVALAKKELNYLMRLVGPVIDEVIVKMRQAVEMSPDKSIVQDQLAEMDHILDQVRPACRAHIETCDHLIDEYDRAASDKTNSMLNILTVITFIIIPIQLLSGIYGMNFRKMPELRWGYGYEYFWYLATGLTLLAAIFLSFIYRYAT